MNKLPDWLVLHIWRALLGEIYPSIRAIAAGFEQGELTIRYYLDRNPCDFDFESIEVVATNISAAAGSAIIKKVAVQCILETAPLRDINHLSGFIYCRREYDMGTET